MTRVPVEVAVTRILTWPTLDAAGPPEVVAGEPLSAQAAEPQRPPKNGTETGYRAPANKTLLLLLNGALAKKGVRQAAKTDAKPKR